MTSTVAAPTSTKAIRVSQLGVKLGGSRVLRDISLDVGQGGFFALIGPNGAGKSTLARCLVGLVNHSGRVSVDGADSIAHKVAYVPQHPVLPLGMTVAEYVLLGRSAHMSWLAVESDNDRQIALDALDRLELLEFAGRELSQLSGGEAQRVTLARALVSEAQILILDEPTSSLDLGHQMSVLELIDELRKERGLTVVAALHDLTAVSRFADRVALLSEGRLAAVGPPNEVLTDAILSEHYNAPIGVLPGPGGSLVVVPLPTRAAPAIK